MSGRPRFAIVLTPHATEQLEREMAWSRRRWGRRHQRSFRRDLVARLGALAANPYAHPVRADLEAEVRIARHGGLLIAYLVDAAARRVVVVAFPNVHRELGTSIAEAVGMPPQEEGD